jgi:hypothetical protein
MFNIEGQMNQYREQARQAGLAGNAIIDVHPASGIIRIKVNVVPLESTLSFVTNYAQLLNISLTAMNIETKVHFAQEEKKQ